MLTDEHSNTEQPQKQSNSNANTVAAPARSEDPNQTTPPVPLVEWYGRLDRALDGIERGFHSRDERTGPRDLERALARGRAVAREMGAKLGLVAASSPEKEGPFSRDNIDGPDLGWPIRKVYERRGLGRVLERVHAALVEVIGEWAAGELEKLTPREARKRAAEHRLFELVEVDVTAPRPARKAFVARILAGPKARAPQEGDGRFLGGVEVFALWDDGAYYRAYETQHGQIALYKFVSPDMTRLESGELKVFADLDHLLADGSIPLALKKDLEDEFPFEHLDGPVLVTRRDGPDAVEEDLRFRDLQAERLDI